MRQHRHRWLRQTFFAEGRIWNTALVVGVFLLLAVAKLWQWHHWLISAFDGGVYMQAMWLTGHGLWDAYNFYSSQPNLADADQWLLIPLGYLARLGGPTLVMLIQAAGGAALCAAVYAYARDRNLPLWPAVVLALAAFVYPAHFGLQIFDWHPDVLGAAFLAWTVVAARRHRFGPFLLFTILTLATKNQAAPVVAATGVSLVLRTRRERQMLSYGLWASTLGIAVVAINEWATVALGGHNLNVLALYGSLGGSVGAVALHVLRNPWLAVQAVIQHLGYWRAMLEPLAYLPLLAPFTALPGFAVLVLNGLGDEATLTVAYDQFASWAAPALLLAATDAVTVIAAWAARAWPQVRSNRRLWATSIVVGGVALCSCVWFLHATFPNEAWRLRPPPAYPTLVRAAALIPPDAAVMGEPGTATTLSWRRYSGSWPFTRFQHYVDSLPPGKPLYILVAPGRSFAPMQVDRERAWLAGIRNEGAVVVFQQDGVLLMRLDR